MKKASNWKRSFFTSLGWLFLGLLSWKGAIHFAEQWASSGQVGVILFSVFAVLSITSLLSLGRGSKISWLADLCKWASDSPGKNFVATGLAASYFIFLRPYLVQRLSFVGIIEWGLILLFAWRLLEEIKFRLESQYTLPLFFPSWKRHVPLVEERGDEHLWGIRNLEEEFVERGKSAGLLRYLQEVLAQNNWAQSEIEKFLKPLKEYRGAKAPRFSPPWQKRRLRLRELRNRQRILEKLMEQVGKGVRL